VSRFIAMRFFPGWSDGCESWGGEGGLDCDMTLRKWRDDDDGLIGEIGMECCTGICQVGGCDCFVKDVDVWLHDGY